ncbi:sulfotransferase family protein [Novosphingobium sp. MMS21-SN21R]|uniref:sulfotransferase family protein n=1 Tax=Novosphingobium sp. MMS21-SN21R TaxID=2969298 RepID=UPI0028885538|nr:sulfotransferase family protein [Novosphingobium sp. MMS21-SN21R]MDT0508389.1 sulfotransferase family protein [Novosphingobium sp. MMS21-SN21R]
MKALAKSLAGGSVSMVVPQCRFETSLFLIGHMRCGSTALSAILCSRPDTSGYGEAHIAYTDRAALGVLALNQIRRRAWTASATTLFDKILHSRYDRGACPAFFSARALFMARAPQPAIRSIRHLFAKLGSGEYATDAIAADYYEQRLLAMLCMWPQFAADRRAACTYEALTANPDGILATLSDRLRLQPALVNRYAIKTAASARGAGDPLTASRHTQIVAGRQDGNSGPPLDLTPARIDALNHVYRAFCALA